MRINEIRQPSNETINESVLSGQITEAVGNILKTHTANRWSKPMTPEESLAEDQRILAEAGIQ